MVALVLTGIGASRVSAQQSDVAYCDALSDLAKRYLLRDTARGHPVPDVDTVLAIDACIKGNMAQGIAVLERKLTVGGFTLPPRS